MLRELRIENLLLIERAELNLGPGLNVLTGETGAGKTVLAHSLDLLMGGKARKGILRPGAGEAWVEGVFDLPREWKDEPELAEILERLPADAEDLVLGRRVSASGRTSAFVGGRAASAGDLQTLATRLLAFYGQHEHRRLTIGSVQTAMVDGAGGPEHQATLSRYRETWREHRRIRAELDELVGRDRARERDLDLHRFELDEIEAASPVAGEKETLEAERMKLRNAEGLREAASGAAARLRGDGLGSSDGAAGELARARDALAPVRDLDPELEALAARVESLALELEDVGVELGGWLDTVEADPERLAFLDERLDLLDRLERKHGGTVEAVLAHAEWCREEIARLESGATREQDLRQEMEAATRELDDAAAELGAGRHREAARLAERITADLGDLAMTGATLTIELRPDPDGPGPSGAEWAEFMLATNPGMEAQPLRDSASGGELSRVMLALAASGAGAGDERRTLVFDEIDTGIGGNTAGAVGDRLRDVATGRQVIAITHLPQVAARAATHFSITKDVGTEPATARVTALSGDQLIDEIRRMMGANAEDEAATRHATELIAANR